MSFVGIDLWNSKVIKTKTCIIRPVTLLISPSAHLIQSKQQTGFPFWRTFLVPGGHFSLQTDTGTCMKKTTLRKIHVHSLVFILMQLHNYTAGIYWLVLSSLPRLKTYCADSAVCLKVKTHHKDRLWQTPQSHFLLAASLWFHTLLLGRHLH